MMLTAPQKLGLKVVGAFFGAWLLKSVIWGGDDVSRSEIATVGVFERITAGTPLGSSSLNPQKYPFLQSRLGREGGNDLFDLDIASGMTDFWSRFQIPFATAAETVHLDEQVIKGTVEELMSFNGWAAAACTTLTRPFAARTEDSYSDLSKPGRLFFFALVVHSADHFFIDQLAAIVQVSRKLGTQNIFVSILDYASSDSTPFLSDLAEAVLILLGVPFRIRRVPPMTEDPAASYYPLEEAVTRNLALEPLYELYERRKVVFSRVIWLKGFTCPNDLLETLRVSFINAAAMVCSMDWKEHNGFFIYNDRWRTRDLDGNLFRGSKSTSSLEEAPPRHRASADRYNQHLPFQVFCCESGSHVVDPHQTYYAGIRYRSSVEGIYNMTASGSEGKELTWTEGACMDSSQMHFCRDIWLHSAKEGVKTLAREAFRKQKSGKPRGLSEEMEEVVRIVASKLSVPAGSASPDIDRRPSHPPTKDQPKAKADAKETQEKQGNVDLGDGDTPQADFDQTDGVGAGRDIGAAAAAAKEEAGETPEEPPKKEDVKVGGKPLPKGQGMAKRDGIVLPRDEKPEPKQDVAKDGKNDKAKDVKAEDVKAKDDKAKEAEPAAQGEDALTEEEEEEEEEDVDGGPILPNSAIGNLPNSAFTPARILVNPRCITTYAGVSHTQLALDLFGSGDDIEPTSAEGGKYHFDEWEAAPNAFVCQEMRTTGGRISSKQQRRTGFQVGRTLRAGWRPGDRV